MRLDAWIGDTLTRIYPRTEKGTKKTLRLHAARGERVSFQVCLRRDAGASDMPVKAAVSVTAPDGIAVRVRRVGYVPQRHFNTQTPFDELDGVGHVPGLVPDPLFDESEILLPAGETHAFWLTVSVPENATPGHYAIPVEITGDTLRPKQLAASLFVSNVVLAPRKNFHMLHWFYADAICDWYKVKPFEKAFWPIVEAYMRNYAEHDNDIIYLPVFTPPLDGVKRPTQLLKVARKPGGKYAFDWTDVKKWVEASRRCGIGKFEWTHWFSQWGVKHALRIYEEQDGEDVLLWPPDTGATSRVYRNYLAQFLPSLKTFLAREGLMDKSFFHVSDEPHGEENRRNYIAARNLLKELAPWMKVMDALSEIEYGREGLTDMPVPTIKVARQFHEEGIPSWCYFCCGPRGRYLNRLFDTPLAKIRMSGWLFYRFRQLGFLHWGYNYWHESQTRNLIDPFTVADGKKWPGWAYGDTFVVYPGPDGPIDSIRWEVFHESMQDYRLLQTAGVDPDGRDMRALKDFDDFPKDGKWLAGMRRKLLGATE